jgi:hypothetical protein
VIYKPHQQIGLASFQQGNNSGDHHFVNRDEETRRMQLVNKQSRELLSNAHEGSLQSEPTVATPNFNAYVHDRQCLK